MQAPGKEGFSTCCSRSILAVAVLSVAVFAVAHYAAFTNKYVINDDVRQQIYWMQKWQDPALYKSDLLGNYAQLYVPAAVQAIYRIAAFVVGPIAFSKLLTGLLFVSLGVLIFMIGQTLRSRALGWACLAVYWLMPYFLDSMSGGLARSFAFPLLAAFMLGWFLNKSWLVDLALILQALLIPYIFLLCLLSVCLSWISWRMHGAARPVLHARWPHVLTMTIGVAAVFFTKTAFDLSGYGPLVSIEDMRNNLVFTAIGRYEILPSPGLFTILFVTPWEWIAGFHELGPAGGAATCSCIAGLSIIGLAHVDWRSLRPALHPALCLITASLVLYALSRIMLMKLFIPDRYLMYTVNLAYCLLLGLSFHALWHRYGARRLAGICLVLAAVIFGTIRNRNVGLYDYSEDQPLCEALATTPKTALVAAHPALADNILTFGKRNVLVSFELAHPWAKGYWREIEPRLHDFFTAYYAENPARVRELCRKYAIDYIVVDSRHFAPPFIQGHAFFAPFDKEIQDFAAARTDFALESCKAFEFIQINKYQRLLDMRDVR